MGRPLLTIEKVFESDFIVIDLNKEYTEYADAKRWAVTSKLSEAELMEKYSEELEVYVPFIYLTQEQGWAIIEDRLKTDRKEKEDKKFLNLYGYEDSVSEIFCSEIGVPDYPTILENNEYDIARKKEKHRLFNIALEKLTDKQRDSLLKKYLHQMTEVDIAKENGITKQAVCKHISKSKDKFFIVFKDFYNL